MPGSTGTKIDLTRWQPFAANPQNLVNEINRVVLGGRMSAGLANYLLSAIQTQPASNPLGRVRAALTLALNSSEYLVEH